MAAFQLVERKVQHLGTWPRNSVDNRVIDEIKQKIMTDKGPKVKLQLSGDGLRVLKTSMIQGKMLMDFIPLARLQFFTVVKTAPEVVFIVSLGGGQQKFCINVFRFANGMDASYFSQSFRKVVTSTKRVTVVRQVTNGTPKEDEINWTLRSKEQDNKRQLSQLVDMSGDHTVTTHVTEDGVQGEVIVNGNHQGELYGNRMPIYRKGKPPTRIERESLESEFSDNRSEVSEGALRVELESLSQELRDIKLMLEKSTGITASSEPGSPRDFEPVNVKVHHHTVNPETVVVRREALEDNIDAVVITEDSDVQMRQKLNGYTTVQNGDVTHVRVSVPDYRPVVDRTETVQVSTSSSSAPVVDQSHYEIVETRKMRPSTTSYESWKRNTMERNAVRKFNDFPERIQWRSRNTSNRNSHVVTARPRSAIPAFSTDAVDSSQLVEVRHHSAGLGTNYHRVSFNPRVVRVQDRQTQSLRVKGLSTTVAKPIDRVYVGRADAKHHSLSYRPRSAELRPSILVKDNPNTLYIEQNNNLVKPVDNEEGPLDVSEIDLYREAPIEGAVIRT